MTNTTEQLIKKQESEDDIVALVRHTGDLSTLSRLETLKKAIDLIGGFGILKSPFIVKTNIHTNPGQATTMLSMTSAKMVEAIISLALKENQHLSVKIVESDSGGKFADEYTWKRCGYKDLVDKLNDSGFDVSLVNLSQPPLVNIKLDGLYFKELEVNKLLTEKAYFVSVMVPKTHSIAFVTGVTKNMFGLLPRKNKGFYHPRDGSIDINHVILDSARIIKPDLCVLDAIVGLESTLPATATHGRFKRMNAMIVGRNLVSVDATMTRLMGFKPETVRHLVDGAKLGLGTLNPKVVGENVEDMIVKFKPPNNLWPSALVNPRS